jgi:hypothetical protein
MTMRLDIMHKFNRLCLNAMNETIEVKFNRRNSWKVTLLTRIMIA